MENKPLHPEGHFLKKQYQMRKKHQENSLWDHHSRKKENFFRLSTTHPVKPSLFFVLGPLVFLRRLLKSNLNRSDCSKKKNLTNADDRDDRFKFIDGIDLKMQKDLVVWKAEKTTKTTLTANRSQWHQWQIGWIGAILIVAKILYWTATCQVSCQRDFSKKLIPSTNCLEYT